ncbi:MAG TPA: alpha-ribazole phosphatase family protein [Rhodocyclaceae bacterium]|nr:alpha-ribazole phosphatase family protein [Rhodocyclaceae bacterium]
MRLFLIRHPQPDIGEGICYGRTDLPLRESWPMKMALPTLPSDVRVISSPLQRCVAFATTLFPHVDIDARLRELDFGAWEMQDWQDISRTQLDAWAADPLGFNAHGGESVAQMRLRVRQALADLDGRDCVWVTHAGVMKIVVGELLALPQDEWLSLRFAHAEVITLDALPDQVREKSAGSRWSLTRQR